jgi:hypothetical protein
MNSMATSKDSTSDWTHPHDPDAKITKMKDGRTHLAHRAEQVETVRPDGMGIEEVVGDKGYHGTAFTTGC